MVANVNPWEHRSRYGHEPIVMRDGIKLQHDGTGTFTKKVSE